MFARDMRKERNIGQFKSDDRKTEQYNDIMANVKPMHVVGSGMNQKVITGTAVVPLGLCFVDGRYQKLRAHRRIRDLVEKWDERKLSPIVLVAHPEEHRFAVVDGQGRCRAAKAKGIDRLHAIILMDAPEDYGERLKFEASFFINQDSEVEPMKDFEKHQAMVIIGDPRATAIDNMMNKYKVSIKGRSGKNGKSILGSYTEVYNVAKRSGERCLDFVFSVISDAKWNEETNGYSSHIIRCISRIYDTYRDNCEEVREVLVDELKLLTPELFSAKAQAKYAPRDKRAACILYLQDIVCERLNLSRMLFWDDEGSKGRLVSAC